MTWTCFDVEAPSLYRVIRLDREINWDTPLEKRDDPAADYRLVFIASFFSCREECRDFNLF
jgi:hypothetical protein